MSTLALTLEDLLTAGREEDCQQLQVPGASAAGDAVQQQDRYPELFALGQTLEDAGHRARFDGVRQNMLREVQGNMCTLDQAIAYLENFELHLLKEAASGR